MVGRAQVHAELTATVLVLTPGADDAGSAVLVACDLVRLPLLPRHLSTDDVWSDKTAPRVHTHA
jgi:hypothetical protein